MLPFGLPFVNVPLEKSNLGRSFIAWVSPANFLKALHGDYAWSLVRTLAFAMPASLVELALGLGVALFLQAKARRGAVWRSLLLLPMLTPPVMVGLAWKLMLSPNGGLINGVVLRLHLLPVAKPFLSKMPFAFAALKTLPEDLSEAARLDGAIPVRAFSKCSYPCSPRH